MTALDDTTAMASASSSIGSPVLDGSAVARSISKTLPRSISDVIRARLEAADAPYLANDNIADHLKPGELELLQQEVTDNCLLYTSPSPRDGLLSRMPSSA